MPGSNKNSNDRFPAKLLPLLSLNTHIVTFLKLSPTKAEIFLYLTEYFAFFSLHFVRRHIKLGTKIMKILWLF